jgi:UDP-N-acetylmuramyl pentapeptide synthase
MRDALQFFIASVPRDVPCTYVLGTLQELGTQAEALHRSIFAGLQFQSQARFILIGEPSLTRAYQRGLLALGLERTQIRCCQSVETGATRLRSMTGTLFLKGSRLHKLEALLPVDAVPESSFVGGT